MSSNTLDIEKIKEDFSVHKFFTDKHGMFRISEDIKEVISEISLKIWIFKKNESTEQFRLKDIVENMKVFNDEPPIFKAYGGVHGAKYVNSDFSVLVEDIGRHNCIDKIAGIMLGKNVKRNGIMFVSGRISSEIITKIVRMEIPVIVSRSTPTVPAIKLAQKYGVTVIGYLRGESGIIYSGTERILL